MKRETPYTDERLTRAGLVGYLRYMKQRGLVDARESLWVQKVAKVLGKPIRGTTEPSNPHEAP